MFRKNNTAVIQKKHTLFMKFYKCYILGHTGRFTKEYADTEYFFDCNYARGPSLEFDQQQGHKPEVKIVCYM